MKPQDVPEMTPQAGTESPSRFWVWLCWGSVGFSALFSLVMWLVPDHLELLAGDFLVCSPNTFRDFDVYRLVSEGFIPLEGPSTSIGGHHGYLAYWLIGGWFSGAPSFAGLQIFGVTVLFLSLLSSYLLARRVSSSAWAAVGVMVFLASPILFLIHYPNHIVLIPVATTLSLYGLFRCEDSLVWPILTSAAVVLCIGAHRTGWLLLVAVFILDWKFGFRWLRRGYALIPVALYCIPEVISAMASDSATGADGGRSFFGDMDPILVLQTMPFHQFKEDAANPGRWAELAFVAACMWSGFRATRENREGRALWWFYSAHFALYPFYRFDLQYYMGMFAVLPALVALALHGSWKHGRRFHMLVGGVALSGLIVFNGLSMHRQIEFVKQPESKHFRSIAPELETIRQLDTLGATPEEVLACGEFPFFDRAQFSLFYRTFSIAEEADTPAQYRYLLKLSEPSQEGDGGTIVATFDAFAIHRIPAPPSCKARAKTWTENLMYWQPSTGEVVIR